MSGQIRGHLTSTNEKNRFNNATFLLLIKHRQVPLDTMAFRDVRTSWLPKMISSYSPSLLRPLMILLSNHSSQKRSPNFHITFTKMRTYLYLYRTFFFAFSLFFFYFFILILFILIYFCPDKKPRIAGILNFFFFANFRRSVKNELFKGKV